MKALDACKRELARARSYVASDNLGTWHRVSGTRDVGLHREVLRWTKGGFFPRRLACRRRSMGRAPMSTDYGPVQRSRKIAPAIE